MKIVPNLSIQNMVSLAIRPLAAFNWPRAAKFPDNFPANFQSLITVYPKISTICRLNYAVSIISFIFYSTGAFLAVTVSAWVFLYLTSKKKFDEPFMPEANFAAEINGESSSEGIDLRRVDENAFYQRFSDVIVTSSDDEFTYYDAEETQFQETLLASIFPSQVTTTPPIVENPSRSFCEICLEEKDSWQMFENDRCSHSFCYECTSSHIVSKIQDKAKEIPCPAVNCKAVLNYDVCRLMIPEEALVQWDEILCMSLIPDSQKLYCPFRDCSALLVKDYDDGVVVGKIKCVVCKRRFCGECRVDWHSNFTCKEYQKHFAKKGGKSDRIVKLLAKKKKWQKCPRCKMYVEKAEGCVHITCRCKYEFCYRCGSKWSDTHGNCQQKS